MGKILTVLIAPSLGLAAGACSKCEIPDLLPKTCKTGAADQDHPVAGAAVINHGWSMHVVEALI